MRNQAYHEGAGAEIDVGLREEKGTQAYRR